jgi:fatty-acid desaturase
MVIVAIPFFTWKAFAVCMITLFLITPLGVNLCYHRLLSHRGFKVPQLLEYALATLGAMLGGGPPMHWVAEHRLHHRYSDTDEDPHNSREGFWHAHISHLFYHKDFEDIEEQWMKYVPDMSTHAYYRFLNKYWLVFPVALLPVLYAWGGWSFVLWVGFVRVVLMLHITWFVNSASHLWGYCNYKTDDNSKNCWWVGILAAGEGWHNNHHAHPVSAKHGHKWWEIDLTHFYIRSFEFLGLAKDVKRPSTR